MNTTAIRYHQYGKPLEVLTCETLPVPEPEAGQVWVRMLAATIHPSDIGMILGNYGRLRRLPAIAGREGVGEIVKVGMDCRLHEGQRVRFPPGAGAWQTLAVVPEEELQTIPQDIPAKAAAMCFINPPAAWRLLQDFEKGLSAGSWIAQNAANSAVGLAVIRMAGRLGLKSLNFVRRPELIEPLQQMGADTVLLDEDSSVTEALRITGDTPLPLALNSVGGESAIRLTKIVSRGGTMVTFGGMSFETVRFPTRQLIFQDITLCGFWLDQWYREHNRQEIEDMQSEIFDLVRQKVLYLPVEAVYPLGEFRKAIEHAAHPRLGKVQFHGD